MRPPDYPHLGWCDGCRGFREVHPVWEARAHLCEECILALYPEVYDNLFGAKG